MKDLILSAKSIWLTAIAVCAILIISSGCSQFSQSQRLPSPTATNSQITASPTKSIPPLPTFTIPKTITPVFPTITIPTTITPITTSALQLQLTVTSPVGAGAYATCTAKTAPGAICSITVYYKSGPSTAQGLYTKTAGSAGSVSWTWKVGTNTTPGTWRIVVRSTAGNQTASQTIYFTVT